MTFNAGGGDLSSNLLIRSQVSALRLENSRSGERLSTGRKIGSDLAKDGHIKDVYTLDKDLRNLNSFKTVVSRGNTRFEATQSSLQVIREVASDVSLGILSSLQGSTATTALSHANRAEGALETVVSTLNLSIAGESLFSGATLTGSAVIDAADLIRDVETIITTAPDSVTALASVDFYFNDPAGGFATSAYLGSSVDAPSLEILGGKHLKQNIRADNTAIKETIRNLTLMAAVAGGTVLSEADKVMILRNASSDALQTNEKIVKLEQEVGLGLEGLEQAGTRLDAQKNSLETAYNEITKVDAFEEATRFEELMVQLETSYSVMVRLSSLSLLNFLK